jgi:hypothetical protein
MLNAASANTNVRIFFANLQGICTFFSNSPQRTGVLDETVKKLLPRSAPTRWNFNSRVVCTVFEHRKDIRETMRQILNQSKNASTINQASGHLKILTSNSFVCWLNLFYKIMPHVDILFAKFQREKLILLLPTKIYYHLKISYYRLEIISPNFPRPINHQLQNDVRPISVRNTLEKQKKFVILLCVKSKNASALLAT